MARWVLALALLVALPAAAEPTCTPANCPALADSRAAATMWETNALEAHRRFEAEREKRVARDEEIVVLRRLVRETPVLVEERVPGWLWASSAVAVAASVIIGVVVGARTTR